MKSADDVVRELGLEPHPEGGFYREIFRDPTIVPHPAHGRPRAALTCIYYLLPAGAFSALHRVLQTEVWHHLDGDPIDLHVVDGIDHAHTKVTLERSQHVVPARAWQAAVPRGPSFSLCGCTVAPGFDYDDFELPSREDMLRLLPEHAELVRALTRP